MLKIKKEHDKEEDERKSIKTECQRYFLWVRSSRRRRERELGGERKKIKA